MSNSLNVVEMNQHINASIYIPRVSVSHSESEICSLLHRRGIQHVVGMDFTTIHKKPGFREPIDKNDKYMSVFVHFEVYEHGGNPDFWSTIFSNKPYRLVIDAYEYWICLQNKNPIPRTWMNIHQVVENGRHLEGLMEEQSKVIQAQNERIQTLEKKLTNVTDVVYQLLGGLFDQTTQANILEHHIGVLLYGDYSKYPSADQNKWVTWPTTRQGDYCEYRLDKLDAILQVNTAKVEVDPDYLRDVKKDYIQLEQDEQAIQDSIPFAESMEKCMFEDELKLVRAEKDAIKQNFKQTTGEPLDKYLCEEVVGEMVDDNSAGSLDSYERIKASWELCGNH